MPERRPEMPGTGPVPDANRPGHHPAEEQDQPDLDAFAERLGTSAQAENESPDGSGPSRRRASDSTVATAASRGADLATSVARTALGALRGAVEAARATVPDDDDRTVEARIHDLEERVAELEDRSAER